MVAIQLAGDEIKHPKTQQGKRALEQRAPQLHENTKKTVFVRGGNTSGKVNALLKDLYQLKKPDAVLMKRKNPFRPFDDETSLEKFGQKYDASLFLFGSHSKKRPHNFVMGRMFDFHVLDMIEFGIENLKTFEEFSTQKCALGTKPCLIFQGEKFQQDPLLIRFKNLLVDFFRGVEVEMLRLQGLEHVWSFTADPDGRRIFARSYRILLKKSGSRTPRVEFVEMGPRFDLALRRSKLASDDLWKVACKQPPELKTKKQKNVSMDVFGTKVARIHLGRQQLRRIQTRKIKALKGNDGGAQPSAKKKRVEEPQE